jgi:hypothetical protein
MTRSLLSFNEQSKIINTVLTHTHTYHIKRKKKYNQDNYLSYKKNNNKN